MISSLRIPALSWLSACLMLILCQQIASAEHIIGGDFTYKNLGPGFKPGTRNYSFTLYMYRDCSGSGAQFDGNITIGIWKGKNEQYVLSGSTLANRSKTNYISIVDDPCVEEPPGICVQVALYEFQINNLPVIDSSYLFTYQRCCRNETISNILADGVGATFQIEITPVAQKNFNNSPVFKSYPPVMICANYPLNFDHSAEDQEGDSLVYSFCAPLVGGGTGFSGCFAIVPEPTDECPPPYDQVTFLSPQYTFLQPMGGNPVIRLDSVTGRITGMPTQVGQYVVGVCIEEYRDGVLYSKVRRDFQFNVTNCITAVEAQVNAPTLSDNKTFYVKVCGDESVFIQNTSTLAKNILSNEWTFDVLGTPHIQKEKDFDFKFPQLGVYPGYLIVNKGLACADTAFLEVEVFPDIQADFSFSYDTCAPGPVLFEDQSIAEAGLVTGRIWDFNGEGSSQLEDPSFFFPGSGMKTVELRIRDKNDCRDTSQFTLPYFPIPKTVIQAPSVQTACVPARIDFDNIPAHVTHDYEVLWDFGDGTTGIGLRPAHDYSDTGSFSISVSVTAPWGCHVDTFFKDMIRINPTPRSAFTYGPALLTNFAPKANFTDQSEGAEFWDWTFDEWGQSTQQHPSFEFQDTGLQHITLVSSNRFQCSDTSYLTLDIVPEIRYFLPNAFTPNADGSNDEYLGTGQMPGIRDFSMTIWSRWGELVFESEDPFIGWNGRKFNSGIDLPSGVYTCIVEYSNGRGVPARKQGFATLLR